MSNTRTAPETEDYNPHIYGGRNPKGAPKPRGHFQVNLGIVIVAVIGLPLAYLFLTGCAATGNSTPAPADTFNSYSLSTAVPHGASESPNKVFQDMSGTYAHLQAAVQTGNRTECLGQIGIYNTAYKTLQNFGVTAAQLKAITNEDGIPNHTLNPSDCKK